MYHSYTEMDQVYVLYIYLFAINLLLFTLSVTPVTSCRLGLTLNRTLYMLRLIGDASVWDHMYLVVTDTLKHDMKWFSSIFY